MPRTAGSQSEEQSQRPTPTPTTRAMYAHMRAKRLVEGVDGIGDAGAVDDTHSQLTCKVDFTEAFNMIANWILALASTTCLPWPTIHESLTSNKLFGT